MTPQRRNEIAGFRGWLRSLREGRGWTREQAADAVQSAGGTATAATVTYAECTQLRFDIRQLRLLAEAYEVPWPEMLRQWGGE